MKAGLQTMGVLRSEPATSQEPVALETTVLATGARPGDTGAKRQLFSEEAQTVLVFERGAVIRLSAAVVDGQLLFLTNKATGKEVVAQVLRKRAFRPTSCYVDLEFTEPCPGFWGVDFAKAEPASSSAKAQVAEESDTEPAKAAAPPNLHEVERLKQEVAVLQQQLQSLTATAPMPMPQTAPRAEGGTKALPAVKSTATISADLAKKQEEQQLEELFALEAKLEAPQAPKILLPTAQRSAKPETKKGDGRKLAVGAMLLLIASVVGAYEFGALDSYLKKPVPAKLTSKPSVTSNVAPSIIVPAKPATGNSLSNSSPVSATPVKSVVNDAQPSNTGPSNSMPVGVTQRSGPTEPLSAPASIAAAGRLASTIEHRETESLVSPNKVGMGKSSPVKESSKAPNIDAMADREGAAQAPSSAAVTAPSPNNDSATSGATVGDYVTAKLLKAVKPVTPPDMMRNYVTGNVNVDAIVDTTGRVKSVTVLSGPAKLRTTAIEQMKQYVYEPAKRNGKPVASHVQASLQFWYEP